MSYNSNEFNNKGVMFVNTNSKSPYCGFNNLFEIKINDESKTTAGDLTIKINSNENSFKILRYFIFKIFFWSILFLNVNKNNLN